VRQTTTKLLFVRFNGPSCDGILKSVTPTSTVAKHMRETVTRGQRLSMTLRHLASGNNFADLKFIWVTFQSAGITVLNSWLLLAGQTVPARILCNTVR